jgi:hypothetical protein
MRRLAKEQSWGLEHTEEGARFRDDELSRFSATVWFNTTGSLLAAEEREAFERFVRAGGGFVAVHAASSSGYDWPFYAALLGALFVGHPPPQPALVRVEDAAHPATAHLEASFPWVDEWYNFRALPALVRVLLSVDERSYQGGILGASHPVAWCHEKSGGRAFYTALGHEHSAYADTRFLRHLAGAMAWAARVELAATGAQTEAATTKTK